MKVLKAAEELEKEGHSVEVIDLRTVQPLDIETIIASVEKTNRAIVVQEAQKQAGIAANVVAEITERAILKLRSASTSCSSTGYDLSILHKVKMLGYQM